MGNEKHDLTKADGCAHSAVALAERGWLGRHLGGDADAFPALVQAYQRPVYSFLTRCGVDPSSRDDLFQDIFLKLHSSAAAYQPARPLRPWVFTIAANTIRNHFRGLATRQQSVQSAAAATVYEPADPRPPPDRQLESRQTLDWLEQALAALPLLQRQVILLIAVEGMPQGEVAAILDMPLNSVKTCLRRGRLNLLAARARREACEGVDDGV